MRALALCLAALLLVAAPAAAQGGAPRLRLILVSPSPTEGGSFGRVVLQASDYDGDGRRDYLVGALEANGRVHALSGADGHALYSAEGTRSCDFSCNFGDALARLPDVTGDGIDDVAVGARDEPAPGGLERPGAAYLVSGASGAIRWRVTSPTPSVDAGFGYAVGATGDLDGDGWADVVVTEAQPDPGLLPMHFFSGRSGALLFSLDDGAPSIAPLADRTGDGVAEFAAGLGDVLVYDGATATPVDTLFNPVAAVPGTSFGSGVAEAGDLDGDGVAEVVVGASTEGGVPGSSGPGRAYVFSGARGVVRDTLSSANPRPGPGSGRFGFAVAGGADVSGDGVPDVAVGAPYESTGGFGSQGHVYVFSGADGSLLHTLTAPVDHYNVLFGWSVAFVATPEGEPGLAVGAPGATPSGPDFSGRVYVYAFGDSTVASSPGPEVEALSVAVGPNPSAGAAWATVTVGQAQAVRVSVVDALGRVVAVLHDGPVAAGGLRLALPAGLAAGVYAVVAEGAGASARARWVVAQ